MKFDAALPPVRLKDVPAIAKAAEEIGFDALWTQETQHDPFLPCALIAEHTDASPLRDGDRGFLCAFAREPRLHRLGPRRAIRRTIHPGAWHTGQGAHRAEIWSCPGPSR